MVPSWTETLLKNQTSKFEVVGRTRFCEHPQDLTTKIPAVGGTKDIDWEKIKALNADLLILDQEENPKFFAESSPIPWIATHVKDIESCRQGTLLISNYLDGSLDQEVKKWDRLLNLIAPTEPFDFHQRQLPGLLNWLQKPKASAKIDTVIYMIWKNPWMCVSKDTYIGSLLSSFGFESRLKTFSQKYPQIELSSFDPSTTLILFSSEPFPFAENEKHTAEVTQSFSAALVDGAKYSWFGTRSREFLEEHCLLK
jgi:hypothetical protein